MQVTILCSFCIGVFGDLILFFKGTYELILLNS